MSLIGVSVDRVDGPAKVTGTARYTADFEIPGMLHCRVLRSTYPHARLKRVDASKAEALPGVVVLTGADLRESEAYYGVVLKDQPIVAIDKVRFVGDIIAAVAAEDLETADEALDLIDVEYEPLPPVNDPIEAMRPGAPLLHEKPADATAFGKATVHLAEAGNVCGDYHVEMGDVEAGFAESDFVFEDTYSTPMIQHGHIEPHVSTAWWEASGKLVIHSSTQSPSRVRITLADLFNLPESQIRIVVPYLGAGYGAKHNVKLEPLVAALARKARKPVQWLLTREEVFLTAVRHPAVVTVKTGVKKDGTLVARQVKTVYDTGAYAELGPRVMKNGSYAASGPYRIPNQKIDGYCVYTNKPSATSFRGLGVPQVCWAYESQMDDIARRLNMDPVALRLKNLVREGDVLVTGEDLNSVGIADCLKQVAEALDWTDLDGATAIEAGRPGIVRGKGVACMIKSTATPANSGAVVRLNADGSVNVLTSTCEIGQGTTTALAQITAETLGVPMSAVDISLPDTDVTPYDYGTISSRSIFSMGHAIQKATVDVRRQLLDLASDIFEADPEDLQVVEGAVQLTGVPAKSMTISDVFAKTLGARSGSLMASDNFLTVGGVDPVTGKGIGSSVWFWSAAGAEVEVDTETGKVRVIKATVSVDVGKAIDPRQCVLQNEGSMLMGLGSALFEEMVFDNGQPINGSFLDYMLPSMEDFPDAFASRVVEIPHPEGPFGAKGIGEAGIGPVAPAIGNAVANALGGRRVRDLPIRPDRVVAALKSPPASDLGKARAQES